MKLRDPIDFAAGKDSPDLEPERIVDGDELRLWRSHMAMMDTFVPHYEAFKAQVVQAVCNALGMPAVPLGQQSGTEGRARRILAN